MTTHTQRKTHNLKMAFKWNYGFSVLAYFVIRIMYLHQNIYMMNIGNLWTIALLLRAILAKFHQVTFGSFIKLVVNYAVFKLPISENVCKSFLHDCWSWRTLEKHIFSQFFFSEMNNSSSIITFWILCLSRLSSNHKNPLG